MITIVNEQVTRYDRKGIKLGLVYENYYYLNLKNILKQQTDYVKSVCYLGQQ